MVCKEKLTLMGMPDEILLAIAEFHGQFTNPEMAEAVAKAKKLGAIDDKTVPVQVNPAFDTRRQPIAQVCRRLRGMFLQRFEKDDWSSLYIPLPDKVVLPWPAEQCRNIKTITIAPFATLDPVYDNLPAKDPNTTNNEVTLQEYWASYVQLPQLWKATCQLVLSLPRNAKLAIRFPRSDLMDNRIHAIHNVAMEELRAWDTVIHELYPSSIDRCEKIRIAWAEERDNDFPHTPTCTIANTVLNQLLAPARAISMKITQEKFDTARGAYVRRRRPSKVQLARFEAVRAKLRP